MTEKTKIKNRERARRWYQDNRQRKLDYERERLNKGKVLQNRIDKAIEYIETLEKREAYKIEDNENGFPTLKVDDEEYLVLCKYNKLLNILKGR